MCRGNPFKFEKIPAGIEPGTARSAGHRLTHCVIRAKYKTMCFHFSSAANADQLADEVVCPYETLTEEDKLAVFVKALRLLRKRGKLMLTITNSNMTLTFFPLSV